MTSNQHGPYAWGDTHATMARTVRREPAREAAAEGRGRDWDEVVTR